METVVVSGWQPTAEFESNVLQGHATVGDALESVREARGVELSMKSLKH